MAQEQGTTAIAMRYATAFLSLVSAESESRQQAITAEIEGFLRLLEEDTSLTALLRSPVLRREEQAKALKAILDKAKADALVQNFLLLVCQNRRLFLLVRILRSFLRLQAEARGELQIEVQSAVALDSAQEKALTATLQKHYGKTPRLNLQVIPALLGGLVLRVGSKMIDASLASKLTRLETQMKEAS